MATFGIEKHRGKMRVAGFQIGVGVQDHLQDERQAKA